jgi:hypothetical protein
MKQSSAERRINERFPTYLEGQIALRNGQAPIECIVWDLSETGLRIVVSDPAEVPLEFALCIPGKSAVAGVRLIWTDGIHYGAMFTA